MTIILIGLNHRTAPIELREQLAFSDAGLQRAFAELHKPMQTVGDFAPLLQEVVILATCNRLEVYAVTEQDDQGFAEIKACLSHLGNISDEVLRAHVYRQSGDEVIDHLMRVASGLESMILGETQILSQVNHAYDAAHAADMSGAILSHLFTQAIHTGKRAHTETSIGRHTTSVSHAAALLTIDRLKAQPDARILVIGAGEMAGLAAQALKRFDLHNIRFINRTFSRAEDLAAEFDGSAMPWERLNEGLMWADAVISATSAVRPVISQEDVEAVVLQRADHPLVMVDIAVPRDIEAGVRECANVSYWDIDDLQSIVDGHLELRKAAIPQVEAIIEQEKAKFIEWYRARQVTPVIRNLREWAQGIADEELGQTLNRLADADERTRQLVSRMAHRLVNRILHEPTSRLQIQAHEGNGSGYAQAVKELFALDELDVVECQQTEVCQPMTLPLSTPPPCNLHCILPHNGGQSL